MFIKDSFARQRSFHQNMDTVHRRDLNHVISTSCGVVVVERTYVLCEEHVVTCLYLIRPDRFLGVSLINSAPDACSLIEDILRKLLSGKRKTKSIKRRGNTLS